MNLRRIVKTQSLVFVACWKLKIVVFPRPYQKAISSPPENFAILRYKASLFLNENHKDNFDLIILIQNFLLEKQNKTKNSKCQIWGTCHLSVNYADQHSNKKYIIPIKGLDFLTV